MEPKNTESSRILTEIDGKSTLLLLQRVECEGGGAGGGHLWPLESLCQR